MLVDAVRLNLWYRCHMQKPTIQDEDELVDTRTIDASPPRQLGGHCNCLLVDPTGVEGIPLSCHFRSYTNDDK